ncbi:hypothetical protein F53441_11994 [Fusarium austroafricanum]|uniref:Uncharacterized protein n=1 Tax=Fusarium austroafricanum TaxID=2364996 RepID=A0A8H4K0H3_9HYPO|nr:hypothetical protein F53441_11994 [Fusarium austroafricanum]
MASSNKSGRGTVARDFNNALQNTLAFEAMRYTANFARMAQAELSTPDYEELMKAVGEAADLLPATYDTKTDEWPAEAEEINQRIEEKLKGYDKLSGGFKKFAESARTATMLTKRQQ